MLRAPSAPPRPPSVTAFAASPSSIHKIEYRLKPCPPEAGILAAWLLRKLSIPPSARYLVTAPKGSPARCTCPDHERSGWTCKHIGALTAAGLIPAPKPSSARNRKLHAKNARQAIAEAKGPAPPRSPPPPWRPSHQPPVRSPPKIRTRDGRRGGDYARFNAGFDQAVRAHVARLGRRRLRDLRWLRRRIRHPDLGHPGLCPAVCERK